MKYDPKNFTWGFEIEWGDISRDLVIPEHLGKWEYAETDIVNLNGDYRGLACDPLGLEPPVGGEVNTKPTKTWQEQVDRIFDIYNVFERNGDSPTASCVNHGHLHVYVPGLKDDIESLKRLVKYIQENQHVVIDRCYQFQQDSNMSRSKTAKTYLKWDGGRPMPDYMCANIINLANNFEDFIRLHAAGKDGVSMGRPFRHAINTYCMKHTGTIEFRCFRSSIKRKEIEDSFKFVEKFIDAALNGGPDVQEILMNDKYTFPEFKYDHEMYLAWEKTKYDKSRGKKQREFHEVATNQS
jgi:hypothetical protein